jgi:hypothetical protein
MARTDHAPLPIPLRTVVAELAEMPPPLFTRASSIDDAATLSYKEGP